jgi:hypothetical protein
MMQRRLLDASAVLAFIAKALFLVTCVLVVLLGGPIGLASAALESCVTLTANEACSGVADADIAAAH